MPKSNGSFIVGRYLEPGREDQRLTQRARAIETARQKSSWVKGSVFEVREGDAILGVFIGGKHFKEVQPKE